MTPLQQQCISNISQSYCERTLRIGHGDDIGQVGCGCSRVDCSTFYCHVAYQILLWFQQSTGISHTTRHHLARIAASQVKDFLFRDVLIMSLSLCS